MKWNKVLFEKSWRVPSSFWGKLTKQMYCRNRPALRAKAMNLWRSKKTIIKRKLNILYESDVKTESILTLPVSINLENLPSTHQKYSNGIIALEKRPIYNLNLENSTPIEDYPITLPLPNTVNHQDILNFTLSKQEWHSIAQNCKTTLLREWTNLFNAKLAVLFPFCVLKFLYHRINENSLKNKRHYFIAKAICKFTNCINLQLVIDYLPNDSNEQLVVFVKVNGTLSDEHSDEKTSHCRKLSGHSRELVGQELFYTSPINYHYRQFENPTCLNVALRGNMNALKSPDVFRKIKSEYDSKSRFSEDMFQDIIITQSTYDLSIIGANFNGYIQSVSRNPFVIHMYTEEQIGLIKNILPKHFTLNLDATGSVIRNIDKSQKNVLYYALTMQHSEAKVSPIPLAEMISSD